MFILGCIGIGILYWIIDNPMIPNYNMETEKDKDEYYIKNRRYGESRSSFYQRICG